MFWVAFVAALGGLLFGFDTAVISGAEKQIQQVYALNDFAHGFTIATEVLDNVKALGYKYSTIGAITISIADMTVPDSKKDLISATEQQVVKIEKM